MFIRSNRAAEVSEVPLASGTIGLLAVAGDGEVIWRSRAPGVLGMW